MLYRDSSPSSPARAAVMLASSASFAVWVWNSSFMAAVTAAWMSVSFQVGDFLQIFFPCSRRFITEFDEVTVRQLVSNIKVVSKDTLLICFKDGTEITQTI